MNVRKTAIRLASCAVLLPVVAGMLAAKLSAQTLAPNSKVPTTRRGPILSGGAQRAVADPFAKPAAADKQSGKASPDGTHQTVSYEEPVAGSAPAWQQPGGDASKGPAAKVARRTKVIRGAQAPPQVIGEEIISGEIMPGEIIEGGEIGMLGESCDSCGTCGGCESCGSCFPGTNGGWCWWNNTTIFGGVQGFKGARDEGQNGNFGFHEGINFGAPLMPCLGVGFQVGYQGVHSDFEGTNLGYDYRSDTRNQQFLTAGFFHRVGGCLPWQWGVVWDFQHDDFRNYEADVSQIRVELSRVNCRWGTEIGFWGAFNTGDDAVFDGEEVEEETELLAVESKDLYAFFIRHPVNNCGEGRLWAGWTGDGDGLVGADVWLPVSNCVSFDFGFHYLISDANTEVLAQQEESWSLNMNLVFHMGRTARRSSCSPYRPLFRVADNGSFILSQSQ